MESILPLLIFMAAVVYLIKYNKDKQAERDAAAAAQTFAHIACPILVTSNFPDDPTVTMRAEAWRQKLRAAGNPYSERLPIVAYPFHLGANGEGGINTWRTYQCNAQLRFGQMLRDWDAEMMRENDPLFNQHILNQKPASN